MTATVTDRRAAIEGVLLGTAVGDAIGLPREGLSRRRAQRMFGGAPLRHALIGRRGMTSDDTEHTCMVAQALLASGGDPERFARSMAWRLRGWILGLPAGVGLATAKAILKLWIGFPPGRSGVWSAGNGPAMRAAILGVYALDDPARLRQLVRASTRLTHSDPAAEHGALAVALAAAYGATVGVAGVRADGYLEFAREHLSDAPILRLLQQAADAAESGQAMEEYARKLGLGNGISGYINHTVPAAIFCWLRWPGDFGTAVEQVVIAGGDADSTGAIVGALMGATGGAQSVPPDWRDGIVEWPRTVRWMKRLSQALADDIAAGCHAGQPVPLFWPGLLLRNALFLLVVVLHALRRLLPPY